MGAVPGWAVSPLHQLYLRGSGSQASPRLRKPWPPGLPARAATHQGLASHHLRRPPMFVLPLPPSPARLIRPAE